MKMGPNQDENRKFLPTKSRIIFNRETIPYQGRLILKNGNCNVFQPQSKRQRLVFLRFIKLVSSTWFFTITIFLATLLSSWFIFAVLYWLICYSHGDLEPHNLPEFQQENHHKPCIYHINNFASCFLFSIETQHTVGYGIKATTKECPEAIFVNAIQCNIGFIMQGFMAVIIFSKMSLPQLRTKTLIFSNKAVICLRNGKLALMFRIGDMRKNHIIDVRVRAFLIRSLKTLEGEKLIHTQTELKLQTDQCENSLFFNWPVIMLHYIDYKSPLYYLAPTDLESDKFEIIIVLEGTIQTTGQTTQARTSYLPTEIVWGMKFHSLLEFNSYRNEYEVDFSKFNQLLFISTPLCSAAYMEDYNNMQKSSNIRKASSHIKLNFAPRLSIGEINGTTRNLIRDIFKAQ